MNCNPKPEVTCGDTTYDSCVKITVTVPQCLAIEGATCYRQSEVNTQVFNKICELDGNVTSILSSIGTLSNLEGCEGITPSGTTVFAEFQAIYNALCALKTNLNLPITGINTQCLVDPCGLPISTLGQLLQALIDNQCDSKGTPKVYRAVLTQTGTSAPTVFVLENNLGNIVWTRTGAGVYIGTLANTFTDNKTFLLIGAASNSAVVSFVKTSSSVLTIDTSGTDSILSQTAVEIRIYS